MATDKKVEYNFLGNSGLKVSNICLGGMNFGSDREGPYSEVLNSSRQLNESNVHKMLDRFVELGGNFIDTADLYSNGVSEKMIGTWLKKRNRGNIIIATKVRFPVNDEDMINPNGCGLSRRRIIKNCEESLRRLQTDYIDLYQAHLWDDGTPVEETLRTFNDLVQAGKIRYYGFSNVCGWQLQKIVDTTDRLGLNPVVSLQQRYSLLCRGPENEELRVCAKEGIGVLPWSPLDGGMLTGKYKKVVEPDAKDCRSGYLTELKRRGKWDLGYWVWDEYKDNDVYWNLIDVMQNIANKHGKTVAQVALRWLLQQKVVSSVIIGATSIQQMEENMGAATGWQLSEEDMKELSDANPRPTPYPYDMIYGVTHGDRSNPFKK